MAFVTTAIGSVSGPHKAYNIDFSVGAAKTNLRADVQLVQALFRIAHFELSPAFAPPPGEKGIEVDGQLGPATLRFILHWQRFAKSQGLKILLDGTLDPFRKQNEFSTIAHVRYALEILNNACHNQCLDQNLDNYKTLPDRDDIPPELQGELALPSRVIARQYAK